MNTLLEKIYSEDKYARVEFSGLDSGRFMCWVCWKQKKTMLQGCGSASTLEQALEAACINAHETSV